MADRAGDPPSATTCNSASELTSKETADEVVRLLDELRLLAWYLTSCRPRVAGRSSLPAGIDTPPYGAAVHVALLARAPMEIAANPNLLEQLFSAVASLSEAAVPASAGSIRLTSAFAGCALDPETPTAVRALARAMTRW